MDKNQNLPLVSIALCTYNGEKFLKEQLDSLVNQTYPNLEILVFDDCSIDGTMALLEEYASSYPFFNITRNEKNLGYVKNFEKAVKSCNGEYIALCDQDDIWDLNKIHLQVNAINGHMLVYHDSELIADNGESFNKNMSDIINLYHGDCPETFLIFNCVSGHSCLIDKNLLQYSLPFKRGYYHDHWLAYVAANVGSIGFVDKPLVKYRQHPNSNTDILRKKSKKNKGYHENRDVRKLESELKWLKFCAQYPHNKNPQFVNKFARLFEERMDAFISLNYALFLYKHKDKVLYIQKKSVASKNTFIYKQIWGLRAKLFWGKIFD
jgi:glycosyltransferase involved in cell wall biosynthesis